MAIDLLNDYAVKSRAESVSNLRNKTVSKESSSNSSATSSANSALGTDDVVFTDSAKTLTQATNIARESDGIDYEKVARIKQQLKDGTFEFNYDRIADKLLASEEAIASIF